MATMARETPQPQPEQPQSSASTSASTASPSTQSTFSLPTSTKLLIGGSAFFVLSAFITRRSLNRRRLAAIPQFYTTASHHKPNVSAPLEALEALNLATLNVLALAILGVGAGMKAVGFETLDELRRIVRGGLGADGTGRTEQQVEEDMEEWVVSVLNRKASKENANAKEAEKQRAQDEIRKTWLNERGKER
ncbi:hypothetical protein GTR04_4102 [Trichophyton interdigitale]|uniref:Altered inheritance of mitochondria protein 11 n=2 Tax=Trichophyton interdigitale TaxID=101480 RepID=A0A9P4YH24_9EURO|nr:hypothetical protein H101_04806 [Trichophyton interdigitale H6]KAF3893898.1 hypothetical protein GY631_3422 [Trichophyton interdigitale]KAF3894807.1 hypothetical protein GY632_3573 [Trichophyton interdigitale]KAG8208514.1 hypothetical protein GTR04_4102 [Trichophyton interdigitale]KDB20996.1 hypothetical protein H109_07062 [Trichophyton interdigitale MR816]